MSLKSFESNISKELKRLKGGKVKWVEWRTNEAGCKKNLQEGEKMIYLSLFAVWVAYK